MAAINSENKLAFFQRVESADRRAAKNSNCLPSLKPASPQVAPEVRAKLKHQQDTYKVLYRKKALLSMHVVGRQKQLYQLNPILFQYLSEAQKAALKAELSDTQDLINQLLYLNAVDSNKNATENLNRDAKLCADYLLWLDNTKLPKQYDQAVQTKVPTWSKGLFGSSILFPIYQQWCALQTNGADSTLSWLSDLNNIRLYWVWGNTLIDTLFTLGNQFDIINLDIFNDLESKLKCPVPITGNMSWSLYYVRFLLRGYFCIRPILPWAAAESKGVPLFERLLNVVNEQKYGLINDSIWGTINLACYAWLTYQKNARVGYIGDVLTAGFLIMDWLMTILDYLENLKQYYQACHAMEKDITHLEHLYLQAKNDEEKAALSLQIAAGKKRLADYKFDFVFKNIDLINGLIYSTLLLLSFPLLIGMIAFPGSIALSSGVVLAGALLCFAITVLFQAVTNFIPVAKASIQNIRLKQHRGELEKLLAETTDTNQQKILLIQIADLDSQIHYQMKEALFQSVLFLRALAIDILTPVVVFLAIFTVPVGAGIGMIAAGLLLAIGSKLLINKFTPSEPEKVSLSDEELNEKIEQKSSGFKFFDDAKPATSPDESTTVNTDLFCPA